MLERITVSGTPGTVLDSEHAISSRGNSTATQVFFNTLHDNTGSPSGNEDDLVHTGSGPCTHGGRIMRSGYSLVNRSGRDSGRLFHHHRIVERELLDKLFTAVRPDNGHPVDLIYITQANRYR